MRTQNDSTERRSRRKNQPTKRSNFDVRAARHRFKKNFFFKSCKHDAGHVKNISTLGGCEADKGENLVNNVQNIAQMVNMGCYIYWLTILLASWLWLVG